MSALVELFVEVLKRLLGTGPARGRRRGPLSVINAFKEGLYTGLFLALAVNVLVLIMYLVFRIHS
jgi:hypothetical protein